MKNALSRVHKQKGFTLIEVLVVIGILSVLLLITLVAINPARQFASANNTQRSSDVNTILNAINQYASDNKGVLPAGIPTGTAEEISSAGVNLCSLLVTAYIAALPSDPLVGNAVTSDQCSGTYSTGYFVVRSATNSRVTVSAPSAELGASISATR